MTDTDLDQSYSTLCTSLGNVGEPQSPLFLAMLCLSLISRFDNAGEVMALIRSAEQQCLSNLTV